MNTVRLSAVALCALLLLAGGSGVAQGQFTALRVSGSPATFTITTATAGSQPVGRTDNTTTYFVKAKKIAGPQKITAQLDRPMPPGTILAIQMVAPPGATSLGAVALDAVARNVVININKINGATFGITYTFTATVAAGVIPAQSRIVTLTLSTYP